MLRTTSLAIAASLIVASPAIAGEPEVQTRRIRTADLNLGSAEDRAILDRRIRSAARQLCQIASPLYRTYERQCVLSAIAGTRPQVARLVAAATAEVAMADTAPHH